jgi:hypothetical protein
MPRKGHLSFLLAFFSVLSILIMTRHFIPEEECNPLFVA